MTRHGYQYVVLRCVPRVDREEFLNVGVVLYSQGADFLEAAYRVDAARLRAFAPEVDVDGGARRTRDRAARYAAGSPAGPAHPGRPGAGSAGSARPAAPSCSPGRCTAD